MRQGVHICAKVAQVSSRYVFPLLAMATSLAYRMLGLFLSPTDNEVQHTPSSPLLPR